MDQVNQKLEMLIAQDRRSQPGHCLLRVLLASNQAMVSLAYRVWWAMVHGLALYAMSEIGGSISYQFEDAADCRTPVEDNVVPLASAPVKHLANALTSVHSEGRQSPLRQAMPIDLQIDANTGNLGCD